MGNIENPRLAGSRENQKWYDGFRKSAKGKRIANEQYRRKRSGVTEQVPKLRKRAPDLQRGEAIDFRDGEFYGFFVDFGNREKAITYLEKETGHRKDTMDTYGQDITEFKDAKSRYGENLAEMTKQIALCMVFKELGGKKDDWEDDKI